MEIHETQSSPRTLARLGGLLYLIIIAGGLVGEVFVRGTLIVEGNATATLESIRASELLWRVGIANEYLMLICSVVLTLLFYVLLRPVSKDLALLAVFFNLLAIGVEAVNELNLLATFLPVANTGFPASPSPGLSDVMPYLPLDAYGQGWAVGLIFFGVELLILGHLIIRSQYLPKALGVLFQLGGLSYLVNSFALIVSPPLADRMFPTILLPAFVAELSVAIWLLLKGVDLSKWPLSAGSDLRASPATGLRSS